MLRREFGRATILRNGTRVRNAVMPQLNSKNSNQKFRHSLNLGSPRLRLILEAAIEVGSLVLGKKLVSATLSTYPDFFRRFIKLLQGNNTGHAPNGYILLPDPKPCSHSHNEVTSHNSLEMTRYPPPPE